jgi:hypothetical protein
VEELIAVLAPNTSERREQLLVEALLAQRRGNIRSMPELWEQHPLLEVPIT